MEFETPERQHVFSLRFMPHLDYHQSNHSTPYNCQHPSNIQSYSVSTAIRQRITKYTDKNPSDSNRPTDAFTSPTMQTPRTPTTPPETAKTPRDSADKDETI